jgi:hypothetical protein
MSVSGIIFCVLVFLFLLAISIYGVFEEIPQYCPYCGEKLNDQNHWCDGKITAIRNSQKMLYDNAEKMRGKTRLKVGRKIIVIQKCNCGKIGNIEVLVDLANKGENKNVFTSGYMCEKCKVEKMLCSEQI